MKRLTVFDKRTSIRDTLESSVYRHLSFGREFLLGIVGKKHISPTAIARFNFRREFVFLHWFLPGLGFSIPDTSFGNARTRTRLSRPAESCFVVDGQRLRVTVPAKSFNCFFVI